VVHHQILTSVCCSACSSTFSCSPVGCTLSACPSVVHHQILASVCCSACCLLSVLLSLSICSCFLTSCAFSAFFFGSHHQKIALLVSSASGAFNASRLV
jgi:hypothetical protein